MTSLASIMSPERCKHKVEGGSQKKIFEKLSKCMSKYIDGSSADDLFHAFYEREHLGSTSLGHGIAIPHCRLPNANKVVGCLFQLEKGVDFYTSDHQPVDIVFGLVAPEEACQEHLDILAQLAERFQDRQFCQKLRKCNSEHELYQTCISYTVNA